LLSQSLERDGVNKGTYTLTKVVLVITELQMLTVVTTNNMKIIVAECPEFSGTGSSIQS